MNIRRGILVFALGIGVLIFVIGSFKLGIISPTSEPTAQITSLQTDSVISHPPLRPLPTASTRAPASGRTYHVSPTGNDTTGDGSAARPWKSLSHATGQLQPGDTLYLRGGIHREAKTDGEARSVTVQTSGTASAPITIRSYPGELAIVDFSYPEFFESPATSWMPCSESPDSTGCVAGEYVSTKKYFQPEAAIYGNFGDSMVPLFKYQNLAELRAPGEYRNETNTYYTGPGAKLERAGDDRIHIRLSHTTLPGRVGYSYQGETDPRKIPLILAFQGPNEDFQVRASNIRLQDFVVRGHRTLSLGGSNIELDGMHIYQAAGPTSIGANARDVRILRSKIHGPVAPWTSRYVLKNWGGNLNLMVLDGEDIEIAYSELTDAQDGIEWGRDVENWSLHHNVFDNFVDDMMNPKGMSASGTKLFYQNYVTAVRQVFGFDGQETSLTETPGAGLYVYRNIFDFRRFTYGSAPANFTRLCERDARGNEIVRGCEDVRPNPNGDGWHPPKLTGDHEGGILRPSWRFYHNVIASWRGEESKPFYMMSLGTHYNNSSRWVYNNVEIQVTKKGTSPTLSNEISEALTGTLLYGGNVHWALDGATNPGNRPTDIYADPLFVSLLPQFGAPANVPMANFRLQAGSPAINKGVPVPADWPDPFRGCDAGAPDAGAFPLGVSQDLLSTTSCSTPAPLPPADTTPPTVSVSAPAASATVSETVAITASASDDVGVASVQFRVEGLNMGSGSEDTASPYSFLWNTTTVNNGTYSITAIAKDAAGNTTTSPRITVAVSNAVPDISAPSVTLTNPSTGTVVGTVTLRANALDNIDVAGVQFKANGANVGSEDVVAPYETLWLTDLIPNGVYNLLATARDAAGNMGTSGATRVTVSNIVPDTSAPAISVNSSGLNASISDTVTLSASASDNVGVTGVQFKVDGVNVGSEDTRAPYSISWSSRTVPDGVHTVTAVARDAAGNSSVSAMISITVSNEIPPQSDTTRPAASITTPEDEGTVSGTITVSATATDEVGIAGVQFKLDGDTLGAEDISSPYEVFWNTETVTTGRHTLTATARDAAGNTKTSASVRVTVTHEDTTLPAVKIVSPSGSVSGIVAIQVNASDDVGVTGVQFKVDGENLGAEDTVPPFEISWDTSSALTGSHVLTAVARDQAGNVNSDEARVTISRSSTSAAPRTTSSAGSESSPPAVTEPSPNDEEITPGEEQTPSESSETQGRVRATVRLFVRSAPTIGAPSITVATPGTEGTVVGDPITRDGYNWIKVRYENGIEGWSAQNWLIPAVVEPAPGPTVPSTPSTPSTPSLPASSSSSEGDRVRATERLFVRTAPAASAAPLTVAPPGTGGTIVGTPVVEGNYTWIKVRYDNGVEGWSAQNWLVPTGVEGLAPTESSAEPAPTTPAPSAPSIPPVPPAITGRVYTSDSLSVRLSPTTNSSLVGVVPEGTHGTVIEGPVVTFGYPWYKVRYDNGVTGWSSRTWLKDE